MEGKEIIKSKKNLTILQIAATDKENLTSRIGKVKNIGSIKSVNKNIREKRFKKALDVSKNDSIGKTNSLKTKIDTSTLSDRIVEADLLTDNPSENYWKNLAESRSKALDIALKENVDLHNKINELEYENERLKVMLDEAKSLVEVLTEMIEDNESSDNGGVNHDPEKESCSEEVEASSSNCGLTDITVDSNNRNT